jgi:hypothetical protein
MSILENLAKKGATVGGSAAATSVTEQTANQYYKNVYLKESTGTKKSFKDWLAEQKEKGNIDKAGKLIWEKLLGQTQMSTDESQPNNEYKPDYSYTPKPKSTQILGMSKPVAIAVVVVAVAAIGYGIYAAVKAAKK